MAGTVDPGGKGPELATLRLFTVSCPEKFRLRTAPVAMIRLAVDERLVPMLRVPSLTVREPVWVKLPERVNTPAPDLVRLPTPEMFAAKVTSVAADKLTRPVLRTIYWGFWFAK